MVQKKLKKWRAYITYDGKWHHLGYFDTKDKAYAAYCRAALKHFGEFAQLA